MDSDQPSDGGATASDAVEVLTEDGVAPHVTPVAIARPKQLWLVGGVALISLAVAWRDGQRYLASWGFGPQSAPHRVLALAMLAGGFLFIYGLVVLQPRVLRVLVGLFVVSAGWSAHLAVLKLLTEGVLHLSALVVLVLPPVVAAWYLTRPSVIKLAERYNNDRRRNAMDKFVRGRLRKP